MLLARYSGQDDVVVGVPVAGRDLPESQLLVGYFVNPVPVRCQVDSSACLGDVVKNASRAMLSSLANSMLPFSDIVKVTEAHRTPGANPVYQVINIRFACSDGGLW